MSPRALAPLACVVLIAPAGCGPRAAGPAAQRAEQSATISQPGPALVGVDEHQLTTAARVALRFTLATRSWTPQTYLAQYHRRLALSTGPIGRALRQAAPTRTRLAEYRADGARASATAVAVTTLLSTAGQARYRVLLDERSHTAGRTARQRASYLVELRRRRGRWLVDAFTIRP